MVARRAHLPVRHHLCPRRRRQQPGGLHRNGTAHHAIHYQHIHRQPGRVGRHNVPVGCSIHADLRTLAVMAVRRSALPPRPDDDVTDYVT